MGFSGEVTGSSFVVFVVTVVLVIDAAAARTRGLDSCWEGDGCSGVGIGASLAFSGNGIGFATTSTALMTPWAGSPFVVFVAVVVLLTDANATMGGLDSC